MVGTLEAPPPSQHLARPTLRVSSPAPYCRHLGFKTWAYTPTLRGFDTHVGYWAGSTDYYTQRSLCWPDPDCFTNSTPACCTGAVLSAYN